MEEFGDIKASRGLTCPRRRKRWKRAKMLEGRRGVSVRVCNLISGH